MKQLKFKAMLNGIIIPCYNEEERLKISAFQNFIDSTANYQLCFVNDGSADNTINILKHFMAQNPNKVMVLDLQKNVGKAEAIRRGVQYITEMTLVQTIGFLDADLATGFNDYQRLADILSNNNNYQMVIGSRKLNEDNIDRSAGRAFASNCFGKVTSSITKLQIADTQCGAKVFTKSLALQIFKEDFISRWLFDLELLVRVRKIFGKEEASKRIAEIALDKWEEVEGSKITLKDSLEFPKQLVQIAYHYNMAPSWEGSAQFAQNLSLNMRGALGSFL